MAALVETAAGKLEGNEEDGYLSFKGVPYAAPPVGPLRWHPPQPMEPWDGIRNAKDFGCIPPQLFFEADPDNEVWAALGTIGGSGEPQSEDCLFLNVYTPALDAGRRPVMVWIPGGGFHSGSGSAAFYDGRTFAQRGDVVVVTINYRLGALGFLNLNEITGGRIPATGNEGLLDQVAALEWVRDNIGQFGGDPDNVTIFGESAGGMSCGTLLSLPGAKGLFHKVIAQSGASHQVQPLHKAVRVAERFLEVHGLSADDTEGLYALSEADMIQTVFAMQPKPGEGADPEMGGAPMRPVIDGEVMPRHPLDAVADGYADGIPVIAGATLEENRLMSALRPDLMTLDDTGLLAELKNSASWQPDAVVEVYRAARADRGEGTTALDLLNAIETDRVFRIPSVLLTETLRDRGQPAFSYLFTWRSPLLEGLFGACHGLDIGFTWGTHEMSPAFCGSGPEADRLAEGMQDAWVAFARTGDPSCSTVGEWPAYGNERETMCLGVAFEIEKAPLDRERAAWTGGVPDWVIGWI